MSTNPVRNKVSGPNWPTQFWHEHTVYRGMATLMRVRGPKWPIHCCFSLVVFLIGFSYFSECLIITSLVLVSFW